VNGWYIWPWRSPWGDGGEAQIHCQHRPRGEDLGKAIKGGEVVLRRG